MRRFLIPTLLAAGFGPHDPAQAHMVRFTTAGTDDPNAGTLFQIFKQGHEVTLADHRSHSSHSSHSSHASHSSGMSGGHSSHMSHTSHRSSTGGYDGDYSVPQPVYSAPPEPPPAPPVTPQSLYPSDVRAAAPMEGEPAPLRALPGRSKRLASIVRRVQIALLAQGNYAGGIDGIVGPALRAAIRSFQKERNLAVTGTITPELLDALRVASE